MPFHAVISAQRPLSYILRQEDTGAADGESKAKFHICMCILYVYYAMIVYTQSMSPVNVTDACKSDIDWRSMSRMHAPVTLTGGQCHGCMHQ